MVTVVFEIVIGGVLAAASLSAIHDLLYGAPHLEAPMQERPPDARRHI